MLRPIFVSSFRVRVLAAFLLLAFVVSRLSPFQYTTRETHGACPTAAQNVVVIARTGASEAALRVLALMRTSLRCAEHVFLYSDLEQDIGPHHLVDALDKVAPDVVDKNPEFELYYKQQQVWKNKQDLSELQGLKTIPRNKELAEWTSQHHNADLAAWQLDKYKFFHVLEKTWALKPGMDWYVMIDMDSYLNWPTLLLWLDTLNPAEKSYFGSQVWMDDNWFAHGGSGILLSRAAVSELVRNNTAALWDGEMGKYCCGDFVLALGLKSFGIDLQHAWPMFTGERPSTIPFNDRLDYWCGPAVSFHHLGPEDMETFAEFEESRPNKTIPLTHSEIFKDFIVPSLPSYRDNWDGTFAVEAGEFLQKPELALDSTSFEQCSSACQDDEKCFQYSHHNNTCYIGRTIRLGFAKEADQGGLWRSGWDIARISNWLQIQPECGEASFPAPGSYETG